MGEIAHVATHAALVSRFLARIEGVVGAVQADILEDEAQDLVIEATRQVWARVRGELEVVVEATGDGFGLF